MNLRHGTPYDEAEVWGLNDPCLKDYPKEGIGKRSLTCKRYDKCLYKAAVKDWDCFNCEGCRYEAHGHIDFIPAEFIGFVGDDDSEDQNDVDFNEASIDCLDGLSSWVDEGMFDSVNLS